MRVTTTGSSDNRARRAIGPKQQHRTKRQRAPGLVGAILLVLSLAACDLNVPQITTQIVAPPTVPTNTLAPLTTMTPRFTATPIQIPTSTLIATELPTITIPVPTITPTSTVVTIIQVRGSVDPDNDTVRLRTGPGTDFDLIRTVPGGTLLSVVGANDAGDWYFVQLDDGAEGWMAANLVTVANPDAVAIVTTLELTRRAGEPVSTAESTGGAAGGNITPTLAPRRAETTDVLAYCDLSAFRATDANRRFDASTPITIYWNWYARTPEQIQDHLDYSRYAVTLDVRDGETWRAVRSLDNYRLFQTGVEFRRAENRYYVYWYVPLGALDPGQYRINYRVTWTQLVEDGEGTFGPGGGEELNIGDCLFTVR